MHKYRILLRYAGRQRRSFLAIAVLTVAASVLAVAQPWPLAIVADQVLLKLPRPEAMDAVFQWLSLDPTPSALLLIAVVAAWLVVQISPTGHERVAEFLTGLKDPTEASYHVQRSFEAIVNGGWFGVGIGRAQAKLIGLPVPPTDSIFAVIAEELGRAHARKAVADDCLSVPRTAQHDATIRFATRYGERDGTEDADSQHPRTMSLHTLGECRIVDPAHQRALP